MQAYMHVWVDDNMMELYKKVLYYNICNHTHSNEWMT